MAEQQQHSQSQSINTGANIAADGLMRFSPQFYAQIASLCVHGVREAFFVDLDNPKTKVTLKFADAHKSVKTLLPVGYLSYHMNSFLDFLLSDDVMRQFIEACNKSIAIKVVMKPMDVLINENVDRIVRAARGNFLELVESVLDQQSELMADGQGGEMHAERDVVVKNRRWIISQIEAVNLQFSSPENENLDPVDSENELEPADAQ